MLIILPGVDGGDAHAYEKTLFDDNPDFGRRDKCWCLSFGG